MALPHEFPAVQPGRARDALSVTVQGTVGLEIADQLTSLGVIAEAAIVNCSGGGLASGVITALRAGIPKLAFYLTEIAGFEKWARSLASHRPEQSKPVAQFSTPHDIRNESNWPANVYVIALKRCD